MSLRRYYGLRRRIAHLPSMASMILWFVYCLAGPTVAGENKYAETMYRTVLEQVGRVTVEQSLKALRDVLNSDRDFAPAHYEIAKLYLSLDTPLDRQSARNALDAAIRLDRRNGDYQLMLGELLGKQGLWPNAEGHYEKIYENFPEHRAQAAYMVGFFPCELS